MHVRMPYVFIKELTYLRVRCTWTVVAAEVQRHYVAITDVAAMNATVVHTVVVFIRTAHVPLRG